MFPSLYPCSEFMNAAGILQDFRTLVSNAGLENFINDEPPQYAKLTMSVVQDFRCELKLANPVVHYKIYNIPITLPFDDFCTAIRVPQWGSREKIKERPGPLMDLYKEICQGRNFTEEDGKIRNIQFPSIRYFAYFITKCVLARKVASKLSSFDLAFISAALKQDRTYNLGALIAQRLSTNRERGGICGGLIASRLLAFHGVVPHCRDIQFPLERLDFNSMMQHKFLLPQANQNHLVYELTFFKKSGWKVCKSARVVNLPAPLLFNLYGREVWSLMEHDLDNYIEEHGQHVGEAEVEVEDDFAQHSGIGGSSYQDDGASSSHYRGGATQWPTWD